MNGDINKDCDYYIKEVKSDTYKYNVFYVNKDIPLNEKIIKEMEKYDIIEFADKFNQPIDNLSVFNPERGRKGLKKIIFGYKFNQPVDNLPSKIKEISFGTHFNQSIDNLIYFRI